MPTETGKPVPAKSTTDALAEGFLASRKEIKSERGSFTPMPLNLKAQIKEVLVVNSQFFDGLEVLCTFKDETYAYYGLEYTCSRTLEAGDKLRISSLNYRSYTGKDGKTYYEVKGTAI